MEVSATQLGYSHHFHIHYTRINVTNRTVDNVMCVTIISKQYKCYSN